MSRQNVASEIWRDWRGEWRFRLVLDGHVLANSADGYATEEQAAGAVRILVPVGASDHRTPSRGQSV